MESECFRVRLEVATWLVEFCGVFFPNLPRAPLREIPPRGRPARVCSTCGESLVLTRFSEEEGEVALSLLLLEPLLETLPLL